MQMISSQYRPIQWIETRSFLARPVHTKSGSTVHENGSMVTHGPNIPSGLQRSKKTIAARLALVSFLSTSSPACYHSSAEWCHGLFV
jgi:hypothetical protein